MLGTATWPSWSGRPRDGVVEILQSQGYSQEAYALGRTKVFIRNPQTLLQLEERRRDRMHDLAVVVQKMWRGWHQRQIYLRIRAAQILLSAQWRSYSAWRHYERVKWATLVLCSYTRGWQARRLAARLRYEKLCLWAVGIIRKFFYGWQARKLAAQLRHEKLVLWAVGVIRKYFMGWQVRKEYRKMFRKVAGPKISRFMQVALKVQYLENLRYRLPSMSPLDNNWPPCSPLYLQTHRILREIFHRWRCNKYRARFDDSSRKQMEEKVAASDIFREKKSVYPKTVSVPFKGDYVRIRQNEKWKKVCLVSNDQHVMFADIVQKVNRKNGKMVPHLFVLSTQAMLILDQRSMVVKYRIPLSDIRSMHLSPFQDKIVFFHLSQQVPPENGAPNNGDFVNKKGDFVMSTEHVVEVVAKTCLQALNIGESRPEVHITPQFTAEFAQRNVDVVFKMGVPEVPPGTVKIVRKSNKLEVLQP